MCWRITYKAVRLIPQELAQVGTFPSPQSQEIVKVFQIMDDCTEEQIVDMPAALCQEDSVEVIIVVPVRAIGWHIKE